MGQPNPEYDDENERTVSVSFSQIESELDSLHLVVGEEVVAAEQSGDAVRFTLEQTGET